MQIFFIKKINIWFIAPIRRQGLFLSNELSFAIITEAMRMSVWVKNFFYSYSNSHGMASGWVLLCTVSTTLISYLPLIFTFIFKMHAQNDRCNSMMSRASPYWR